MKNPSKAGFTLIELLVVIAIIAILAGLILPALSKSKAIAQRSACLSKIKQLALASLLYAEDSEGFLPREKCVTGTHTWADLSAANNQDVWANILPATYFDEKGAGGYAAEPEGFHSTKNNLQCPSAKLPRGNADPSFSLAVNSKLNSTTALLSWVNLNSINHPFLKVLFLDSGILNEPLLYPSQKPYNGQPSAWANRLSGRHTRGANLGFNDGRAQWYAGPRLVDPATGTNAVNPEVIW